MINKHFEIEGLGKCLVGTYTIRNLTKHFKCSPEQLLFIGSQDGNEYEFNSYLLKYARENWLVQNKSAAGLVEVSPIDIDCLLDENPLTPDHYEKIVNSICICVYGMSKDDYVKKINDLVKSKDESTDEEEPEKKSLTTSSSGGELTNSLGGTE